MPRVLLKYKHDGTPVYIAEVCETCTFFSVDARPRAIGICTKEREALEKLGVEINEDTIEHIYTARYTTCEDWEARNTFLTNMDTRRRRLLTQIEKRVALDMPR